MLLLVMFLSAMSVEEDDNYVFEDTSESSAEFVEDPTDDGLTPGAIAGIVIAAVILITVVASLIWFFVTKQKNQSVSTESTDDI